MTYSSITSQGSVVVDIEIWYQLSVGSKQLCFWKKVTRNIFSISDRILKNIYWAIVLLVTHVLMWFIALNS